MTHRGGHVALRFDGDVHALGQALVTQGVVVSTRKPDALRLALHPLTTRHDDAVGGRRAAGEVLDRGRWREPRIQRDDMTRRLITAARARLAADIGGTFTDIVLEHAAHGAISCKVLTTPRQPEQGVLRGHRAAAGRSRHARRRDVGVFIHGTTLATNALIERKGARTALLTTEGFRDVARDGLREALRSLRPRHRAPARLVPRAAALRRAASASPPTATCCCRSTKPPSPALARRCGRRACRRSRSASCMPMRMTAHETARARHRSQPRCGRDVTICLSSEVCPEMREYERFSTTCANAYVRPLMAGYLQRLRDRADGARARAARCC